MRKLLSRILFIIILWIPAQVIAQVDDVNINASNDIEPADPDAYLYDNLIYVDSLKSWMSQNDDDSIRALYLSELAYYSAFSSVSQSEKYSEAALKLADSLNSPYLKIYVRLSKANAYTLQGLYLKALQVNQEAYTIEEENPFEDLKVTLVNNIGDSYMELNDYENAYTYFQTSLNMSKELNDSLSEAIAMFNIGRVYKVQKNYTKALEYIYSSKLLSEKIYDTEGAAYSDFELGVISHLQGQYEQAVKFLESSIAISDSIGIEDLTAKGYVKIGNIEEERNNFILALENYYKGLKINDKIKNQKGTAEASLGIGKLQIKMNAMENASLSLYNGLSIALALKDKELESKFYEALSMYYEKRKDYDQSLSYYKLFKINADSVFNIETNMHVALMETQFDSEKKDKEIAQFQEQKASQDAVLIRKQAQNTMLFGGFILVIVVSIGLYITLRNNRRVNHQLRTQKQEIEAKNVQLDKLNHVKDKFFSIISHDLKW